MESNKTKIVYQAFELRNSNDRENLISYLIEVQTSLPKDFDEAQVLFKKRFPKAIKMSFYLFTLLNLRNTIECLQYVFLDEQWKQNANTFSCNAIKKIYFHREKWEEQQQIGKSKYGKVKIADLLSVVDYVIKAVGLLTNIDTRSMEKGVLVLKSVNFAINQQEYEKPEIELTHLGVDLLASVSKDMTDNPQNHKMATVSSILINSIIEFLTSEP